MICKTIHRARAVGKTLILSVEKLLPPTHLCRCPPFQPWSSPFLRRCAVPTPPPLPSDEYAPFWVISYWYFATFSAFVVADDASSATGTGTVNCGHGRRIVGPWLPPPVPLININPRHWRWRPTVSAAGGGCVRGRGSGGDSSAQCSYLSCIISCSFVFPFFSPSLNDSTRARTLLGIHRIYDYYNH